MAPATTARSAAPPRAYDLGERVAFWAWVGVILAFSQCWVMFLTGPGEPPVPPATSASIRNLYFPVYAVVLGLAVTRLGSLGRALLRSPALVLLLAVTAASVVWSIDPAVTARRWLAVTLTTLAGAALAARYPWPRFLEVLGAALGITVVLSVATIVFLPTYGVMQVDFAGAWRGAWSHKNTLGYYMSVAFMIFAAGAVANPKRRALWSAAAVAALVLVLMSQSKTSLLSCLIGGACMPMMALARRGPVWAVAATWLWVSALTAVALTFYLAPDLLLGFLGKDATLTGRTQIWAAVGRQITQRPLIGYGYGAVWDNTSGWGPLPWISKQQGFVIHEAHNTWLGVWLELGYVGLAAWTLLFVGMWLRAMPSLYLGASAYFALPFLAVFSLHTLTESIALGQNDLIWLLFSATAVKLASPDRAGSVSQGGESSSSLLKPPPRSAGRSVRRFPFGPG